MVIYGKDRKVVEESAVLGGTGTEIQRAMFDYDAPDAPQNCELFMEVEYPPGTGAGYHPHAGASEIYYILSGEATYNDNGVETKLHAGDTAVCYDGGSHSIRNDGTEPMRFLAVMFTSGEEK